MRIVQSSPTVHTEVKSSSFSYDIHEEEVASFSMPEFVGTELILDFSSGRASFIVTLIASIMSNTYLSSTN